MAYKYSFDSIDAGSLRLPKNDYQLLQDGFRLLLAQVIHWNNMSVEHGAPYPPYKKEQEDLERMIDWGQNELEHASGNNILVKGISVGSMRYCKAALIYLKNDRERQIIFKQKEGWPEGVLQSLRDGIGTIETIEQFIEYPPAEILWEVMPKTETSSSHGQKWDVFISHASEDKKEFVSPLALKLHEKGIKVWFDKFTLKIGDSLRRSIDKGLSSSRFGIVVLSQHFFKKEWPQKELDGLVALESDGKKVILPIWHNITAEEIRSYSPMLADRVAVSSQSGLDNVVDELLKAMEEESK